LTGLFLHPKRRIKKLVAEGEYAEALQLGKSLEKKYSKDADFMFIMGSTYYILDEADKSLHYLNKVLQINEYDKEALVLKANIHAYLKEKEQALECCEKILKTDPKNNEAITIMEKFEEN